MAPGPVLVLNQHLPPDPAPTGRLAGELLAALTAAGMPARGLAGPSSYGAADPTGGGAALPIDHTPGTAFGRRTLLGKGLDAATFLAGALYQQSMAGGETGGVVVTMSSPPPLPVLGARLARRRQAGLVIWCQDLWPDVGAALGVWKRDGWIDRVATRTIRAAYLRADRVIVLERAMRDRVLAWGVPAKRVAMIPNWAPAALFELDAAERAPATRRALGAGPDQLLVLYSGNLGRVHEFETVLEAARAVRDDERIRLVFAGTGPRRHEAAALARGLPNVAFVDGVPGAALADRLLAADIHLVTLREGFAGLSVPSKAASAWAAGRGTLFIGPEGSQIVRATRLAELGQEVRGGDVAGVVMALQALAASPAVCRGYGANARRWALEHHHPRTNVAQLVGVVRGVGAG